MNWTNLSTIIAVIIGAAAIINGSVRVAGALLKVLPAWQSMTRAVQDNTTATTGLADQFRQYQQVTDRRLEILEEAHREAHRTRRSLF